MKKLVMIAILVGIAVIAGFGIFLMNRTDSEEVDSSMPVSTTDTVMDETNEAPEPTLPVETVADDTQATQTAQQAPTTQPAPAPTPSPVSRYISLADFNSNRSAYTSQKKVYFFHAPWCPICKAIAEDIESDPTQIPSNTTFIRVDYDSNTAMRQKYGVTYQYTFVQVDNNDNEQKQWSATNLDKAIAGIQ